MTTTMATTPTDVPAGTRQRGLFLEKFGDATSVVRFCDNLPVPTELLPKQLFVRVLKSPINPSDFLFIKGCYNPNIKPPAVPGFEAVAIVLKTGSEVTKFQKGDRVAFFSELGGVWQETTLVYESLCIKVDSKMPLDQAAQLSLNPMTAYGMLIELGIPFHSNQCLLQSASGSCVGRFVIQLSKIFGFKTINLVRREEQVQEIKDLGGDFVVCTAKDFQSEIMAWTQGQGVRYAIDAVGGDLTEKIARCLAPRGHLLLYGVLSDKTTTTLNISDVLFKNIKYEGFHVRYHLSGPNGEKTMSTVKTLFEEGKLRAPTYKEYSFEDYRLALKEASSSGKHGKILFNISDFDEA